MLGLTGPAQAQFKVVAPDGSVTYTDRPPVTGKAQRLPAGGAASASSASSAAVDLPFELRQAVARYPVTLITAAACAPCDAGRRLLQARGVPFTERTAATNEDLDELRRLEQTAELPVLRLGAQRTIGFGASEWTGLLDAAGYPRNSVLPAGYKPGPVQALAPPKAAESAQAQPRVLPAPQSAPPPALPSAPGGIRF
jgi:glutaredoxin